MTDMYEINDVHDCCPKLCYAVNKSGDECRFEVTSSSAIRHVSSIGGGLVLMILSCISGGVRSKKLFSPDISVCFVELEVL